MKPKLWITSAAIIVCALTSGCTGTGKVRAVIGPSPSSDIEAFGKLSNPVTGTTGGKPLMFVQKALKSSPQTFARVIIVPLWFSAAADCDRKFSSNDLAQVMAAAASETVTVIAQQFADKGYHVVGSVRVIGSEVELEAMDADARQTLVQAHAEVGQVMWNRRGDVSAQGQDAPIHYGLKTPLSPLAKLDGAQADALVLVDVAAFLETPSHRHKRYAWNSTGGPLFTVVGDALLIGITAVAIGGGAGGVPSLSLSRTALQANPNAVSQTVTIVDVRSQEVLFWNSTVGKGTDLREPSQMKIVLSDLLAGLPQIMGEDGR